MHVAYQYLHSPDACISSIQEIQIILEYNKYRRTDVIFHTQ